jgi:hypothetical protein
MSTQVLHVWTVYDHPADCSDHYIARPWRIDGVRKSEPSPTLVGVMTDDLGLLRDYFEAHGLYRLPPEPHDFSFVIESWV